MNHNTTTTTTTTTVQQQHSNTKQDDTPQQWRAFLQAAGLDPQKCGQQHSFLWLGSSKAWEFSSGAQGLFQVLGGLALWQPGSRGPQLSSSLAALWLNLSKNQQLACSVLLFLLTCYGAPLTQLSNPSLQLPLDQWPYQSPFDWQLPSPLIVDLTLASALICSHQIWLRLVLFSFQTKNNQTEVNLSGQLSLAQT